MSNAGQALTTIGGAVIGFFMGGGPIGALRGAYFGYMAGQIISPTQGPTIRGPRLEDLKAQTSVVGAPIPMVFGTYAIAGNVIWASDLKETKHKDKVGGKGGGPTQKQITYTYSQSLAIGLCESAIPGTAAIQGIRRIWANGKLIYDRSRPRADIEAGIRNLDRGHFALGTIKLAVQRALRNLAASQRLEDIMTVYDGTQTDADPTIESFEGVGNVPAFKDLAYFVLDDLQLEDYGNRAPEMLVEVYTSGTSDSINLDRYDNERLYPWMLGKADPADPRNTNKYYNTSGPEYSTLPDYMAHYHPTWPVHAFGYKVNTTSYAPVYPAEGAPSATEQTALYVSVNCYLPTGVYPQIVWNVATAGLIHEVASVIGPNTFAWWSGNPSADTNAHERSGLWYWGPTGSTSDYYADLALLPDPPTDTGTSNPAPYYKILPDTYAILERAPAPPPVADDGWTAMPDIPGYYVDVDGNIYRGRSWVKDTSTTFKVLQKYTTSGGAVTKYPLGPARPLGDPEYNDSTFWTDAYNAAAAAGKMPSGLVYGTDYPVTQTYAYKDAPSHLVIDVFPVPVADIVTAICERSGMTAGQIDVTDIGTDVDGYAVSTQTDGKSALMPLSMYGLFAGYEADGKLKFAERGAASAVTFSVDELGAHEADSERPTSVEVTRKQDVELPRTIRVTYASPTRDYQQGEQTASRVATTAVNSEDVQVAVAMTDTKALQLAEIYLFDAWTARNGYAFQVPSNHLARTPTDVATLPVDGVSERVRIVDVDTSLPGVLKMTAVRDDVDVLTSYATRTEDEPATGAHDIPLPGPTDLVVAILKGLRAGDNDAGYYVAGRGYLPTWSGFSIMQSFDGGTEYTEVATSTDAATMGTLNTHFDGTATTISVTLQSGTFAAATPGELDAGANLLAVGANGRWELLQFETASLSGGVWTLGGLHRGLRGTSAYEATNVVGDRVLLMSGKGIVRVPLSSSLVGVSHLVKAVSLGTTIDSTPAIPVTSTGDSLPSGGGLTYDDQDNLVVDLGDASQYIANQIFGS